VNRLPVLFPLRVAERMRLRFAAPGAPRSTRRLQSPLGQALPVQRALGAASDA